MKTFIQYLIEKRSNPDKNQKSTPLEQLLKYEQHANELYGSYTELDKIGINPRSSEKYIFTPIGIYTYQLDYMINRMKKSGKIFDVPYMGHQPFIWIIKPNKPVLVLNTYSEQDLERDKNKLIQALNKKIPNIESIINKYESAAEHQQYAGSKIWNITNGLANRNPHRWNTIFRTILGYYIIRDDGLGIIHISEPYQTVFLDIRSFTVVDKIDKSRVSNMVDSKRARKGHEELKKYIFEFRELCKQFLRSSTFDNFDKFIKILNDFVTNKHYVKDDSNLGYLKGGFTFKIKKALGPKLYHALKNKILNIKFPYYIIQFGKLIDDKEIHDKISSNPELILSIVKATKKMYPRGHFTISKSKKHSIDYFHLLYNLTDYNIYHDYMDPNLDNIMRNVLNDKEELEKVLKDYNLSPIFLRFRHLNIPLLTKYYNEKFHKKEYDDTVNRLVENFGKKGTTNSLNKLLAFYSDVNSNYYINPLTFDKLLNYIVTYLDNNVNLMRGLNKLLFKFSVIPLERSIKIRILYHVDKVLSKDRDNEYAIGVVRKILQNSQSNGTFKTVILDAIKQINSRYFDVGYPMVEYAERFAVIKDEELINLIYNKIDGLYPYS